jgi:MFS family permease
MPKAYAWFVAGVGSWALAAGMHQVLFSWLVVGELRESPQWVGAAQTFQTLPSLLFLLLGGVVADRVDRRRLLLSLHAAASLLALAMSGFVGSGALGLSLLIGYGILWGSIQAFASPARDVYISEVSGPDLMRAVTGVTLATFVASALGSRTAGLGESIGNAPTLALQAGVLLVGMLPVARLPAVSVASRSADAPAALVAVREGLSEVWHSARLRPVALLVAADGLFFMGPFIVLCPLLVRDHYDGALRDLSLVMMTLTLGTISGSSILLFRGGLRRKGRAFLLALMGVASCLLGIATAPPFLGFLAIIFAWGVCHAVFFNTSRTLFQAAASAERRGRVLSVHSLGLLGMAPVSNLLAGLLADAIGPLATFVLAGLAMLALPALAWAATPVASLE